MSAETFRAVPRHLSPTPENTPITHALKGAECSKLSLLPQGVTVARVLEALGEDGDYLYGEVVVQIPRRGTKTTTISNTLIGRCFEVPGYRVIQTGQDGTRARDAFNRMAAALERNFPDEDTRPFRYYRANGQERLVWKNGSEWWVVPPVASAFRGAAANVIWVDEAGEIDDAKAGDLIEGAMPLLDTVTPSQIIISGTPAPTREGLLWEYLKRARGGDAEVGIVDFSMTPQDDPTSEDVWFRVHPGLAAGLTPLKKFRQRFASMPLVSFMREYLCADPPNSVLRAIPEDEWEATTHPDYFDLPERDFAIGYDVALDGSAAAVSVAWYAEGIPHVQVLHHKPGLNWVPGEIAKLLRGSRGRNVTVVYDAIGHNQAIWQSVQAMRGVDLERLKPVTMREVAAGVTLFMAAVMDRALRHAKDPSLDTAAEAANFRFSGDSRLWGRGKSGEDISPLVSSSNALYIAAGIAERANRKKRGSISF